MFLASIASKAFFALVAVAGVGVVAATEVVSGDTRQIFNTLMNTAGVLLATAILQYVRHLTANASTVQDHEDMRTAVHALQTEVKKISKQVHALTEREAA